MRLLAPVLSVLAVAACSAPDASTFDGAPPPAPAGSGPMLDTTVVPIEFQQCAQRTSGAEGKPLYLVFAYDESGSMGVVKWGATKAAAKAFFTSKDTQNVSASISMFPNVNASNEYSCEASSYAVPQVPMTALPSQTFGELLDARSPKDCAGTPMRVALEGAHRYASDIASQRGFDTTTAVVLVTDGMPDSTCEDGARVEPVRDLAARYAATTRTFVIGVGLELTPLHAIASAGGTKRAVIIDTRDAQQIQRDMYEAINSVRRMAVDCDYTIPAPPPGQELDRDLVNVIHTESGGKPNAIGYSAECAGDEGWRYDDPATPRRILLCRNTCDQVREKPGRVDVLFGCATKGIVLK